jgi:DNA (cytosine-5)-methyltransferase 1
MRIGSLFSGIGGLELGLERAGLGPVVWQAEIGALQRAILRRRFPGAVLYRDVREVKHGRAERVDLICGGFPCQDLSTANVVNRSGLDGERSGLWSEFRRVVSELGPRWVIAENTGRNWTAWVPDVRRDLWGLGYASVPLRVSTLDVGAPHDRDRVFVVAHANRDGEPLRTVHAEVARILSDAGRLERTWRDPFCGPVRMDDGISGGMERTGAVGNAVSPVVAEALGLGIAYAEAA